MSRDIHASVITELSATAVKFIQMVDLQFDSGSLAFNSSLRSYSYDTKTFLGAGNLGSVSPVQEGVGLSPASCNITLSAVNTALLNAILAEEYLNRRALIYVAFLDANDAIIATPFILFDGLMDSVGISYGQSATITIGCKNRLATWDRDKVRLLTDQQQKMAYPADKGFEFVNTIASQEIIWPAATWRG